MDSVRFGRALGLGARGAVKALVMAADAATAPGTNGKSQGSTPAAKRATDPSASRSQGAGPSVVDAIRQTTSRVHATQTSLARGGKRFGEAVWGPFVRLSGVLWLELTGVFFGLFLLTALMSAWKLRGSFHDTGLNHIEHQRLLWSIAMSAAFGYFCVSSFVRAARREQKRR